MTVEASHGAGLTCGLSTQAWALISLQLGLYLWPNRGEAGVRTPHPTSAARP